jgi:hypothetical protein
MYVPSIQQTMTQYTIRAWPPPSTNVFFAPFSSKVGGGGDFGMI